MNEKTGSITRIDIMKDGEYVMSSKESEDVHKIMRSNGNMWKATIIKDTTEDSDKLLQMYWEKIK